MKQILLKTWLILVCLLTGAGTMWAEKITDYTNIVSGHKYYIGATNSSTDYYLSVDGSSTSTSIAGTAVTNKSNATAFVFEGSGTSWTIKFDGTSNYLGLKSSKDNGKVQVVSSAATFTLSNQNGKIRLTIGSYSVEKNNSGTQFGSYANTQTDVWLEEVGGSTPTTYNVTVDNNIANGTVTASPTSAAEGATVTLTATANDGYEFGSWNVTGATVANATSATTSFTMPAANVNVSATFNAVQGGGEEPSGDEPTYNFADMTDFSTWGSGYEKKTTTFSDGAYVELASANKNASTITDCPVTKGGDVIFKAPEGKKIASLTFTCTQWTTKAQTITLNTSSNGTDYTATSTTSSNFVLSASNLTNVTAVKFTFSSSSNQVGINSIKVTYVDGGIDPDPEKTKPELSFAETTYNATMGEGFKAPAVTNPQEVAVTYSSSVENVATVDSKSGAVTLVAPGTTKITASFAGNETYNPASASYDLVVKAATPVFANLEELVAADLTTGTEVTVSFENVAIKDIFVTQQGYRNGVYFDIQKDGKDIEIYYQNVPAEWAVGGTLSGTLTNCPWKLYSGTWELAPASGWTWTNLTYNAPAQKTITALAVSGTPTKTTYNVGDAFETAGLVVTATYSDNTTAPISTGFDWEIDYGTGNDALVAGATSVDVMAYIGEDIMSELYTVNGLTVNVPVTLTSIAVSGTPTKTEYFAGDAFETAGLVVTGHYSNGSDEEITEGIEWIIDPETLALGTTSVEVMAGVGEIVSEPYTVEGITVTKPDFETATYEFSSFTSGTTVELTDLDGFVITLKGNGGTNPAWNASASEARVYAKGSLTVKANNAIIKSIEYVYTVNANSSKKVPTIDGVEGKTDAGTWNVENKTWTGADEEVTFSTSGDGGNIGFTKLIIKYVEEDSSNKIATSLSWSAAEAEVKIGAADNTFPTLTTDPADLEGVTYRSSDMNVAIIGDNGVITLVKEGEATITASYAGNDTYAPASSVSYTLIVGKATFVPTPAADGFETIDFTEIDPYKSLTTNQTVDLTTQDATSFSMAFAKGDGSNAPKFYQNGNAVRCYEKNTITITGAENIQYVGIAWAGTYVDDKVSITGLGTTTAVVTFSKTCRFTAVTVDYREKEYTRTVTDGYFGTICLPYATSNVEGATIYNIVGVKKDGEAITGIVIEEAEENLIAGKPYIFKATGATLTAKYSGIRATEATEAYGLVGNLTNDKVKVEATGTNYVIGNDNKIHKVVTGGTGVTIGANRAYLNLAGVDLYNPYGAESTRAIFFGLDGTIMEEWGTPTGVESVGTTSDSIIYNLQGQRVNRAEKGVYVVNGRKVLR